MMTLPFEALLSRVGLQPADIERVATKELRGAQGSLLRTFQVTVTNAAALRQVLNPRGTVHSLKVPDPAPVHASDAPPGSSWASRQLGRPGAHRNHAMEILRAAVLGPESALETHGASVEKAWLPARVNVMAAKDLSIAAGEVYKLGNEQDRNTPCSAVFDTLTIAPGGQLVLTSPTFLTVTTLNRGA